MKMDFASCPCHPEMNLLFFAAYFVVHSLFSSALMLHCKSFMTMQRKVSALHLHRSSCCLDNASVLWWTILCLWKSLLGRTESSQWYYYFNNKVSALDHFWQHHWEANTICGLFKLFNLMWMKKRLITFIIPKICGICFKWYDTHFRFR